MKKAISVFFILFILFFTNVYAHDIEDFSNSEWFDNITLDYIIKYQTPYLSKYDIVNFSFPKINNSSDYNDWGFYSVSGLGGVGAIYSVSKEDNDKIIFEYGYYPNSLDPNEKPIKESNPNICTIYILDENTISLLNPPLTHLQRVTLYRKSFKKKSDKYQEGDVKRYE